MSSAAQQLTRVRKLEVLQHDGIHVPTLPCFVREPRSSIWINQCSTNRVDQLRDVAAAGVASVEVGELSRTDSGVPGWEERGGRSGGGGSDEYKSFCGGLRRGGGGGERGGCRSDGDDRGGDSRGRCWSGLSLDFGRRRCEDLMGEGSGDVDDGFAVWREL